MANNAANAVVNDDHFGVITHQHVLQAAAPTKVATAANNDTMICDKMLSVDSKTCDKNSNVGDGRAQSNIVSNKHSTSSSASCTDGNNKDATCHTATLFVVYISVGACVVT